MAEKISGDAAIQAAAKVRYNRLAGRHRKFKNPKETLITYDQWWALVRQPCAYCGSEPNQELVYVHTYDLSKEHTGVFVHGIDRIDSSQDGYTWDNVVPCCRSCNAWKSDASLSDYLSKIKSIYENLDLIGGDDDA